MQEVFKRIALVAASEACVQIGGESGTGKELVARAIHQFSRRAAGPFVAVNIAALNPALVESELFGHVRGAFTGAEQPHDGLLRVRRAASIFLDEMADIPRRACKGNLAGCGTWRSAAGGGEPAGASRSPGDLGHASNLVEQKRGATFRATICISGLSTFQIGLPRLCNRLDDNSAAGRAFSRGRLADKNASPPAPALSPEALAELQLAGRWHGNVRELKNALEHALVLAPQRRDRRGASAAAGCAAA